MDKSNVIYNIGQRIKQRREFLGISQQELADRVGYKSRSSINKIELGINDVGQKALQKIAEALGTTSGVLLGEASMGELMAAETGDKALMAIYETLRTNADLIPPLSEDPETVALHVKSVFDEMKKNGHRFSDMFELTLNRPGSSTVSASSNESEPHVNIIKIAGRDGSFREKRLDDKGLQALIAFVDLLPDAPDNI